MVEIPVLLKQREVWLRGPLDPQLGVDQAMTMLKDAEGVHQVTRLDNMHLSLSYDLHKISLQQIESALAEVGFHLDNSLMVKLKRALYYYTEENERHNLGLSELTCSSGCAVKVFAAHFRSADHGCRDPRPDHLRRYL